MYIDTLPYKDSGSANIFWSSKKPAIVKQVYIRYNLGQYMRRQWKHFLLSFTWYRTCTTGSSGWRTALSPFTVTQMQSDMFLSDTQ